MSDQQQNLDGEHHHQTFASPALYDESSPTTSTDYHYSDVTKTTPSNKNNSKTTPSSSSTAGPGSEEDELFNFGFTNPVVGAVKFFHNTFRYMTGRMTEEEIKAKISKATAVREQVNRSLSRRIGEHVQPQSKRIFVGTWNVAKQSPPTVEEMKIWLNGNSTAKPAPEDLPKIAVIGIQEATMSGTAMLIETTEAFAEWSEAFQSALHQLAKDAGQPIRYRKLDGVQLVGLIMLIFLPIDEFPHVRHLRTAVTRTGPLSTVGNKGAVGCRLTFHGKRLLFICGHFAPHEHNVKQRDHHYHSALDRLELSMPESNDDLADFILKLNPDSSINDRSGGGEDGGIFSSFGKAGVRGAGLTERLFHRREFRKLKNSTERSRALIHSHDYCFFFGDLNYRLVKGANQGLIKDLISQKKIKQLLQYDELYNGLKKGYIFEGFVEPPLRFLPTYKFAPDTDLYDASKRKPAWTDRVLVHCLNGEVDSEEKFQVDRSNNNNHNLNSTTNLNNANGNGDDDEDEEITVGFLEVDDSRGPLVFNRQRSGSDFGGSDYGGGSKGNTPPISPSSGPSSHYSSVVPSPQHRHAGSTTVVASKNNIKDSNSGELSPLNLSPSSTNNNNNNRKGQFPSSSAAANNNDSLFSNNNSNHKNDSGALPLEEYHQLARQESQNSQSLRQNNNNGNDDDSPNENNNNSSFGDRPRGLLGGLSRGLVGGLQNSNNNGDTPPNQAQRGLLPRASASFEDFLASLDRCESLNNTIENHVNVHWYCSVPTLRMSDHRPVASSFDINVAYLSKEQQEILVFDTKQEMGLDFLDDLKYAL